MRIFFLLLLLTAIKISVLPFFFKEQKRFALLIGFLLTVFLLSVFALLYESADINRYIALPLMVLLECGGYWLYMRCGWQKALLAGVAANLAFFAFAILAAKMGVN